MIRGEAVVVERWQETGRDPGNAPIREWVAETVENVLVAPGPRNDVVDSNRPDGVDVVFNLHFPKTYTADLTGCRISVRGQAPLAVVGSPWPYFGPNTPGAWDRPVEVSRIDG